MEPSWSEIIRNRRPNWWVVGLFLINILAWAFILWGLLQWRR